MHDQPSSAHRAHLWFTGAALTSLCCALCSCETLTLESEAQQGGVSLATFEQLQNPSGGGSDEGQPQAQTSAGITPTQAPQGGGGGAPGRPPQSLMDMAPPPPSMEPDSLFDACVGEMEDHLVSAWSERCEAYPMSERVAQGPYGEMLVIGACLQLSCEGIDLEGHNGVMAGRSCYDLDLLRQALGAAAIDANEAGGCVQPRYSLKVVPLDERVFGEPCDQIICQIEPDGLFTRGKE